MSKNNDLAIKARVELRRSRSCAKMLGMIPSSSKSEVCSMIRSTTGMSGSNSEVIEKYYLLNKGKIGTTVKPCPEQKRKRLEKLGSRFSRRNIKRHTNTAVQKVSDQLTNMGVQFKREVPIIVDDEAGTKLYIADFVLGSIGNIILEIDGDSHEGREDYDTTRDVRLKKSFGYNTIRIKNKVVLGKGFDIKNYI